ELLARFGPNQPETMARRSALQIVADQVLTVPTALLSSATAFSLLLGDALEAGAITLGGACHVAVGYLTGARAGELLQGSPQLGARPARVVRGGPPLVAAPTPLAPGDLRALSPGDTVAADGRIVEAYDFTADESTLTGESEPVEKGSDNDPADARLADRH